MIERKLYLIAINHIGLPKFPTSLKLELSQAHVSLLQKKKKQQQPGKNWAYGELRKR